MKRTCHKIKRSPESSRQSGSYERSFVQPRVSSKGAGNGSSKGFRSLSASREKRSSKGNPPKMFK
eukprot:3223457-Prorocentrum_lima.AAC.1